MNDVGDFIEEVWHEVNVILPDPADEEAACACVRSVYRKVEPAPVHTDQERKEQLVVLLDTARDLCVAHLLRLARDDLSTGQLESRAGSLLLRFFEPQIRAAVRRRLSCPHDVESVINDVRRRIWSGLRGFDGSRRQLHCYVKKACESACHDFGRRRPSGEEPADPQSTPEPYDDDGQQQAIVELKVLLRQDLQRLRPHEQQAVAAFLAFDGDWAAAQEALGIPRQTLASRFGSALKRLRREWGSDG